MAKKLLHIGRAPDNDIILEDPSVSKKHLQLSYQEGVMYALDVGSTNGTFINQQKIVLYERVALQKGDLLKLGNELFAWEKCLEAFTTEPLAQEESVIPEEAEAALIEEQKTEAVSETHSAPIVAQHSLKKSIIKHEKKVNYIQDWAVYTLLIITFLSLMLWYFTQVKAPE